MKKSLVLMAMAGVALAGCVNDVADVAQSKEKQKITFGTPLSYSNGSRANVAGEINNPYPIKESFTIYATEYLRGSYAGWGQKATGFDGDPAVYDSNVDGWAPKENGTNYYYWTDGYDMAFAACSPHDLEEGYGEKTYGADGLTITDFMVQENSKEQYDLMFSQRVYDKNASHLNKVEGDYSGIQLTFQHALSSIHFSILNETLLASDETQHVDVKLKSVTISNVYNKGTFKENITEKTDGNYNKTYNKGTGGNVAPEWTIEDEDSKNSQPYVAYQSGSSDLYFPSVQQYISNYIDKLKEQNASANYGEAIPLLLLPQDLPNEACINVKYEVENSSAEGGFEEKNKTIKIKDIVDAHENPLTPTWEIGTRYTYRLVYTTEVAKANRIYFAPTVEDWADGGIVVVHL